MAETQMEQRTETIINVFLRYAVRVRNFNTLSITEPKQLLEKEFPHWLKDQKKNAKAIEQIFQRLDKSKDKQVAIATHEHIHQEGYDGHVHHHH